MAEALEVLKGMSRPEPPPVALSFEVTKTSGGPAAANGVTITSVERDDFGIRVNYDIAPPSGFGSPGPRAEAKDDLANDYDELGGYIGLAAGGGSTDITDGANARVLGGFRMPLPPPAATALRIRITWDASPSSIWERPAHEVRVSLSG